MEIAQIHTFYFRVNPWRRGVGSSSCSFPTDRKFTFQSIFRSIVNNKSTWFWWGYQHDFRNSNASPSVYVQTEILTHFMHCHASHLLFKHSRAATNDSFPYWLIGPLFPQFKRSLNDLNADTVNILITLFPEPKLTSSNRFFRPTDTPKPKDSSANPHI